MIVQIIISYNKLDLSQKNTKKQIMSHSWINISHPWGEGIQQSRKTFM